MRCSTVRRKLEALAADEAAPRLRAKIDEHLRSCPECRRAWARQRKLAALVRGVPAPPMPDGFAERVMVEARLRGELPRPVSRSGWKSLGWLGPRRFRLAAATSAALVAGLLIGGFLGSQTWPHPGERAGEGSPTATAEDDPVGASRLGVLASLGEQSLGEAYLDLTRAPNGTGA